MVPAGLSVTIPVFVLVCSLVIDRLVGDPHSAYHPVALIGRFISWWGRPEWYSPSFQRIAGIIFWLITIIAFMAPFFLFRKFAPAILYVAVAPFLLKSCFAWRALEEHTAAVVRALDNSIEKGREQVKMLVSRNTAVLDRDHVLSAAYESMTENLTDSIVSPIFYYTLLGLSGAALYRAANTMDAMLGYQDVRERLGWFSARMDDLLTYIPARISVICLLFYFATKGRLSPALATMRRDGRNRPGFNGGIVMAVMAGGVGVRFEKPGVYKIGDPVQSMEEGAIEILRAIRIVTLMVVMVATGTLFLLGSWINNMGI